MNYDQQIDVPTDPLWEYVHDLAADMSHEERLDYLWERGVVTTGMRLSEIVTEVAEYLYDEEERTTGEDEAHDAAVDDLMTGDRA